MKTTRFLALTAICIALTFTFSSCSDDKDPGGSGGAPNVPAFVPSAAPASADALKEQWENNPEFSNVEVEDDGGIVKVSAVRTVDGKEYYVKATNKPSSIEDLQDEIQTFSVSPPDGVTNFKVDETGWSGTINGSEVFYKLVDGWVFSQTL